MTSSDYSALVQDYIKAVLNINGIGQIEGCNCAWEEVDGKRYVHETWAKEFESHRQLNDAVSELIKDLLSANLDPLKNSIMWRALPKWECVDFDTGRHQLRTRFTWVPCKVNKITRLTNVWMS